MWLYHDIIQSLFTIINKLLVDFIMFTRINKQGYNIGKD